MEVSELDIVLSQSKDKTVMIEAGAKQVSEDILVSAVEKAHTQTKLIIGLIEDFVKKAGQKKLEVVKDSALYEMMGVFRKII